MNRRVKLNFCGSRKEERKAQQQLAARKIFGFFPGSFVTYKPTLKVGHAG